MVDGRKLSIEEYLDQDEKKDLLRLLTAGSVDDGKSTLIGRLLFDSKKLYEDQLSALERDSKRVGNAGAGQIDYALLCDGLKAEREQGITIDVAYRYFSTNKRKFIIADTPGHEQYTRNMITGGSTANLAIILVDARTGVITQTRRHTFLCSLLGIKHLVLAVNKMDLVNFDEQVFSKIVADFEAFIKPFGIPDVRCIPLSALEGDNVVTRSQRTPWYDGPALLEFLETVHIGNDHNLKDFRYPVQYVVRPDLDFRGFCGKIASGVVRKGDEVMALPSGKRSRVKRIVTYDGDLDYAFPPQCVTLQLEDEIDISRGEMIVHPDNVPNVGRHFEAMLVWMDEQPMDVRKSFYLKQTTITELDRSKIEEQKKAVRAGYDMDVLPSDLATYGRDAKALLKELQSQNERMFLVTFLVLNTGKTEQELETNVFQAVSIAQKHNCELCRLDFQQEQGLMSSLPLADCQIEIQRGLTTSSTAIFVPFTTQELFDNGKESLYYGLNALSNNLIMVDRKKLKNPNGLILGTPGSGKSFSAKREICNAFLVTDDDIIICDPECEVRHEVA